MALLAAACGRNGAEEPQAAETQRIQVGAENVVVVRRGEIVAGPVISGELRPEREATVRAELSGPMAEVVVREGQAVRRGALLGRIEVRHLEDAERSARFAVRSAEQQLEVATREAARTEELVRAGALAARDLDIARSNVSAAEAQLADAQARLAAARTQLSDAVLRAPIGGVVSERAVDTGDVVSPGTALFTIIDPSSMRLEASVPSEALGDLRVGTAVRFTVRGYGQPFTGRIERINPQADPATRQVSIYVSIPNVEGRLVAGLFAEGRVVTQSGEGLIVPSNAVNTSGGTPWVLRVADGRTERVNVSIGLRDPRTERVLIAQGLQEGDVLLRGPAQGITPGTPVQVAIPEGAGAGAGTAAAR
ncbi:MAG TPA: efflux RND transporter periplasmic adaptor subunit [Vicinamibacterales bacterium]|nr:efflux RND transporter periplasmic adaptor subunit [Vicinamibacterales bacterium]